MGWIVFSLVTVGFPHLKRVKSLVTYEKFGFFHIWGSKLFGQMVSDGIFEVVAFSKYIVLNNGVCPIYERLLHMLYKFKMQITPAPLLT